MLAIKLRKGGELRGTRLVIDLVLIAKPERYCDRVANVQYYVTGFGKTLIYYVVYKELT